MTTIARSGSQTASSGVTHNKCPQRRGLPRLRREARQAAFPHKFWREHLNDYLLSVLLGIVEGLSEFLPVSSTAHLRIAEQLMHVPLSSGYWKMYSIVIQLGAILVLPIYFRSHIARLLSTFPEGERKDRTIVTHPLSLVMFAFVVTAIPSYLLTKVVGKNLESLYVMGAALLIGRLVMWCTDAIKAPCEHPRPAATG